MNRQPDQPLGGSSPPASPPRAIAAMITGLACLVGGAARLSAQRIVHLASGDSVAIVSAGPAAAAHGPPGLLVRFVPFALASDSARVNDAALKLFRLYVPKLDSAGIELVVLQAMPRPPDGHARFPDLGERYRIVFEKRADRRWYVAGTASPVDPF